MWEESKPKPTKQSRAKDHRFPAVLTRQLGPHKPGTLGHAVEIGTKGGYKVVRCFRASLPDAKLLPAHRRDYRAIKGQDIKKLRADLANLRKQGEEQHAE